MSEKKVNVMVALMDVYGSNNINDYEYLGGYARKTRFDKVSNRAGYNVHFEYFKTHILHKYPQLSEVQYDFKHIKDDDEEKYKCICGMAIVQRCIIIKRGKTVCMENLIILGNCCINNWFDGELKRQCPCGTRHKCRNADLLCGNCFKESKKKKCIICNELLEKYSRKKECKKCINEIEQEKRNEIIKIEKEKKLKRTYDLYKNWINDFKNTKVLFGHYKDDYLVNLMKNEQYYNYIYNLINHDDLMPYGFNSSITSVKKLFNYINYSQNKLNFLHSYNPDEFYSDSIMDYF